MTGSRKRLSFQLTPLLDLLLIVIFAQYMDVQRNAVELEQSNRVERQSIENRKAALETEYQQRQATLVQSYQDQVERLTRRVQQTNQQLASAFNLPEQLVREVGRLRDTGQVVEAQRLDAASQRVAELMQARGPELVQLLVKVDEMQKHVTFWEVHLTANGRVQLSDGSHSRTLSFGDQAEFVSRTFRASKSLPEPKTLVLILLTYGDTQARFRRDATTGMTQLTQQLRHDAGNTRWYDYSLLGFRPEGPLFASKSNSHE